MYFTTENADSCSIYCVDFLKHNEIITGNSRGNMKVWDLRNEQNNYPQMTFMLGDQSQVRNLSISPKKLKNATRHCLLNYLLKFQTEATAIAHHPTQPHTLIVGGGDGCLTVWDLRRHTYPVFQASIHSKAISEIAFHKDRPENLFTCSASGEILLFKNSQATKLKQGKFLLISM